MIQQKKREFLQKFKKYKKESIFLDMLTHPIKIFIFNFKKFWKKDYKIGCSEISKTVGKTKSPILVIRALVLWKLQTNIWCCGQIDPSLPEIGLRNTISIERTRRIFDTNYALSIWPYLHRVYVICVCIFFWLAVSTYKTLFSYSECLKDRNKWQAKYICSVSKV